MKTSVFKKYKLVIIFLIIIVLSIVKVDAETCTSTEKNNLIKIAKNIEIIPYLDEEYNPMHEYFYNVYITNFSENVYIIDSNNNRFEYDESYTNDSVFGVYKPGEKVTFKVYGAYEGICPDERLTTFTVEFEYYNDYSTLEECQGIEEFYLCKRNYSGAIESKEWFLKQVEGYRNGEVENIDIDEPKKENNIFKELLSNEIVQISIVVIILLIIFIMTRIYINSKKKIKINLNKKRN